jgi:hypothetical protein
MGFDDVTMSPESGSGGKGVVLESGSEDNSVGVLVGVSKSGLGGGLGGVLDFFSEKKQDFKTFQAKTLARV